MNPLDFQNTCITISVKDLAVALFVPQVAKTVTERGRSKPPNRLLPLLIDVANQGDLPDVTKPYDAIDDPGNRSIHPWDVWIRICAKAAATLSPEARAFVGSPEDLQQFLSRYGLLVSAREVLRSLADRYKAAVKTSLTVYDQSLSAHLPVSVTVNLVIDESGLLTRSDDPLLSAFVGVPADRIRACEICNRIFWAPRVNSECCQEKCRKSYNQRNSRRNRQRRKTRPNKRS